MSTKRKPIIYNFWLIVVLSPFTRTSDTIIPINIIMASNAHAENALLFLL